MAILTGIAFCVCVMSALACKIFTEAKRKKVADCFALVFFFALVLLILCMGHWIALLLGRL